MSSRPACSASRSACSFASSRLPVRCDPPMTGRGKAKVLLVLGLGSLGFGAKLLYYQYSFYWPSDLPPTLAFYGRGLVAVSIALAIITKRWVGAAVLVAGAGLAVGAI